MDIIKKIKDLRNLKIRYFETLAFYGGVTVLIIFPLFIFIGYNFFWQLGFWGGFFTPSLAVFVIWVINNKLYENYQNNRED